MHCRNQISLHLSAKRTMRSSLSLPLSAKIVASTTTMMAMKKRPYAKKDEHIITIITIIIIIIMKTFGTLFRDAQKKLSKGEFRQISAQWREFWSQILVQLC